MTITNHHRKASQQLDAVRASRVSLDDLYNDPHVVDRRVKIADAHERINFGLKSAEVHALLAIADAIAETGSVIDRPIEYGLTSQAVLTTRERLDPATAESLRQAVGSVLSDNKGRR